MILVAGSWELHKLSYIPTLELNDNKNLGNKMYKIY